MLKARNLLQKSRNKASGLRGRASLNRNCHHGPSFQVITGVSGSSSADKGCTTEEELPETVGSARKRWSQVYCCYCWPCNLL